MDYLRVFIGWDSKEPVAFSVAAHSILTRASAPVSITPLNLTALRGVFNRVRGPQESTEFSMSRFLVPYLCNFMGYAVFMDCDMVVRTDLYEVMDEVLKNEPTSEYGRSRSTPEEAVWVVKHDYTPQASTKFLGFQQTAYPCKNWSSLMVFNNPKCRALTPQYVNTASGLDLHRFTWTKNPIGSLPKSWNHLVGEENQCEPVDAKILHFTNGGPWHAFDPNEPDWARQRDVAQGDFWREELRSMLWPWGSGSI
jgi:hypothetical protein